MDQGENAFVSQLPQPSRGPLLEKSLSEISASANNTRTAGTMLPPAPVRKHTLSSLPESASKRRTVADIAAGPIKKNAAAPPSTRSVNPAVKSTAIAGPGRNSSLSSSFSSRSNSSASRNTSNSSFSASVGAGVAPQPLQTLGRPKSFFAHTRVPSKTGPARPATAMGSREESQEGPKPKGMSMSKTPFIESLRPSKTRASPLIPVTPKRPSANGCPIPVFGSHEVRHVSLCTGMEGLTLMSGSGDEPVREQSPSRLPKPVTPAPKFPTPSPLPSSPFKSRRPRKKFEQFLTRDSNTKAWDTQEQYENFERMWSDMYTKMNQNVGDSADMKESINMYKSTSTSYPKIREAVYGLIDSDTDPGMVVRITYLFVRIVTELEKARAELTENNTCLRSELDTARYRISEAERTRDNISRDKEIELDDLGRQNRIEIENVKQDARKDVETLKNDHREEIREIKRGLEAELETERSQRIQALGQLSTQGALDKQRQQLEVDAKDREIQVAKAESERILVDLKRERALNADLRQNMSTASLNAVTMETSRQALQAKVEYLESDSKSQSEAYANMERQMREAIDQAQQLQDKLRREETLRRKLHNQVQELKGNIRVFCRVRPILGTDAAADEQAKLAFPDDGEDGKEIEVRGPEEKSSLGTVTTKKYPFAFDRVFGPGSQNQHVFDEISQLIQSALDGFNVCIFCYGQTGSGKTFTMSSEDGMIPRAVHMIYNTARDLEARGWTYTMEGSFVEVYNENLNDLLGRADELDKKKHEIRHDMQTCKTTITDVTTVALDSAQKVEEILAQAMKNRSVAATKANERSSRSHSVFILKLSGHNRITGERCDGTLNLVDLAGSERLSQSKVEGARLKETQNINRSLSCLGDVISSLGQAGKDGGGGGSGGGHIPYRNSKLTYLLQFSLGGNSKTLMFCMVSPLQAHLGETLTSLRFATKVHNTHIGTAKKQVKA